MTDRGQAEAYARADFEAPHSRVLSLFEETFAGEIDGWLLDLGCGPGDITLRFARRFQCCRILAVDGAAAMLELARTVRDADPRLACRVEFLHARIPDAPIPDLSFQVILSTSFLHHLHEPAGLWQTIHQHARPGTKIFIVDLFRPESRQAAAALVETYSASEPQVLKTDFYNSLLAAFRPAEVEKQLAAAGLDELTVTTISDRHMLIHGTKK